MKTKIFAVAALTFAAQMAVAQAEVEPIVVAECAESAVDGNTETTVEECAEAPFTGKIFPGYFYTPVVFDYYDLKFAADSVLPKAQESEDSPMAWVDNELTMRDRFRRLKQNYMVNNPQAVTYNINSLPEAPKQYIAYVDPSTASITVEEINVDKSEVLGDVKPVDVKPIYWIQSFDGLLQFSQAYNSPNWYQGGNDNLNMIINAIYNLKLNPAYHPNLLFENTFAYKLALQRAPEDELRNYSISEDLFQINSKFGIRAAKNWYYSATLQFKTQFLNNYKTNTYDLAAAFLSPAELNIGVGMTYEHKNEKGTFAMTASLAPISYNMRVCANSKVDATAFGIEAGKKILNQYGSNLDVKLNWQIAYNIQFVSHLTAFTDYKNAQGDWENTLSFTINKFLSTQLYVHLRYDSTAPEIEGTKWHKWQLREVLSLGFAYKFGTK